MKLLYSILVLSLMQITVAFSQNVQIKGRVINEKGEALSSVNMNISPSSAAARTDENGNFSFNNIPQGKYTIKAKLVGYQQKTAEIEVGTETKEVYFTLQPALNGLSEVQVFGTANKPTEKLDAITRLPLKASEQIQSISVISNKLIEQQGALSVIEGVRNVPGVYTYSTYGGVKESISSRGFRGIPVLKNGVRVMTDFRGQGFSTDMQGVESIQVLKGASAITMGASTDLGGPGGIVNVVTKTPKFENTGQVSFRAGSWGLIRPTFDVQGVVNESKTLAVRLNGAYENGGKFRDFMGNESFYINPSLEWRPTERSTLTLEMDYLKEKQGIDVGTVNLAVGNKQNQIYDLPTERFLGFESDKTDTKHSTYTARFKHDLNDQLYLRAAVFHSNYDSDGIKSGLAAAKGAGINVDQVNIYNRSIAHNSTREDKNTVFQLDLVGQKVKTGGISHTFQVGADYRYMDLYQPTYNTIAVDQINVLDPTTVTNILPSGLTPFSITNETQSYDYRFGITIQDVIQVTDWARAYGGVRYSTNKTKDDGVESVTSSFWNPMAGVMFTLKPGFNVFGSYTNSTNPRSASVVDINGEALGSERIDQIEAGIKSEWFNDRLRFNVTFYKINNSDMNLEVFNVDENGIVQPTGYYAKGGNDERKGVEVELTGKILPNLEVVTGYAYIDAQYKDHSTFIPGSAPNNTPKHTYNIYANYTFQNNVLDGLNIGAGVYYLGERPYNDWTQDGVQYHAIDPNTAPWYNKAYTIVNAQVAYPLTKNIGLRLLVNNVFDKVGYDAYRTSFIDRVAPRNFSGVLTYKF
ncbi:iron complex outermembrane receptor protein [Pedobacter sp. CAN_A7]|uniref:TonB-dependent siderophore receptor n=1 Tax=Pedobacter sp. CAN_A7 TaxID=2787722 RepID=UPI0018CAF37A